MTLVAWGWRGFPIFKGLNLWLLFGCSCCGFHSWKRCCSFSIVSELQPAPCFSGRIAWGEHWGLQSQTWMCTEQTRVSVQTPQWFHLHGEVCFARSPKIHGEVRNWLRNPWRSGKRGWKPSSRIWELSTSQKMGLYFFVLIHPEIPKQWVPPLLLYLGGGKDGLVAGMSQCLASGHALIKILFTSRASATSCVPWAELWNASERRFHCAGSQSTNTGQWQPLQTFPSQWIWSRLMWDRLGQHSRQCWQCHIWRAGEHCFGIVWWNSEAFLLFCPVAVCLHSRKRTISLVY